MRIGAFGVSSVLEVHSKYIMIPSNFPPQFQWLAVIDPKLSVLYDPAVYDLDLCNHILS